MRSKKEKRKQEKGRGNRKEEKRREGRKKKGRVKAKKGMKQGNRRSNSWDDVKGGKTKIRKRGRDEQIP